MWIVFRTTKYKPDDCPEFVYSDEYIVRETEESAKKIYTLWISQDNTWCAGYAPIKGGTDWFEKTHKTIK